MAVLTLAPLRNVDETIARGTGMSTESVPPEFNLHFEGEATRGHTIPASALIQSIQALQRAVQLLAIANEGLELRQRLRVKQNMERKYAVVFGVPKEGGYVLPYHIGNTAAQLFDEEDVARVTKQFLDVLRAIQTFDMQAIRRALPLASIRRQLINELKKMQPPTRTGLFVSIEDDQGNKLLDGYTASEKISPILEESSLITVRRRLVTGRLDALDFQRRTLQLQLPSGRMLSGAYTDDFEPVLLENPREWIQVRGEAVLNEDDSLKSLNDITEIIEVDVSPITVDTLSVDAQTFNATRNVSFEVGFDPEDGVYTATGDFHMMAAADTRAELEAEVNEALVFLWREYVDADATVMTVDALELRDQLTSAFGGGVDAD